MAGYSWKHGKTALTILAILLLFNEAVAATLPEEKIEKSRVKASNGEYILIAVQDNTTVRLFKQDETGIAEISYPPRIFENFAPNDTIGIGGTSPLIRKRPEELDMLFNSSPDMISWNGKYFLMDNGYSFVKYDGNSFNAIRYFSGFYSSLNIIGMHSLGPYWLLLYQDDGTPNFFVAVFDGEERKETMVPGLIPLVVGVPILLFVFFKTVLFLYHKIQTAK